MMHPSETRVLDINSEALGTPAIQLMENAGKAVADSLMAAFPEERILVVCGCGNNGGDGAVAARYLAEAGRDVSLALVAESKSDLLNQNLARLPNSVKRPENGVSTEGFNIIVDSMLGTGLKSEPREPFASWITAINASGADIVSVDVPSGLGTATAVRPVMTVTFHDVKEGMDRGNSGNILVANIGIPREAEECTGPGEFALYPIPARDSHKGQNGRLLIIGGGPYTGAPALSAFAAQTIGVDLVTIATPESSAPVIASYSPTFIVRPLPGKVLAKAHMKHLLDLCGEADAVLVGPGLGRDDETVRSVREFLQVLKIPAVVDADGLHAMAVEKIPAFRVPAALTPHAREFMKLGGSKQLSPAAVDTLAKKYGATVLLKQPVDIISDGKNHKLNRTGNPRMTVGGTGDVLAGIVAGLMAKGVEPYNAARMGAYLSGLAGDLAFETLGYSMTATDVIACIPTVLGRCLSRV
ncbi:MAG: NAD(P)H-hydrate dehydratase [Thermoplasmata archaeon]|nr:NAD(P)H-hydrate dehydratase [Thermoplasmata archaeon]